MMTVAVHSETSVTRARRPTDATPSQVRRTRAESAAQRLDVTLLPPRVPGLRVDRLLGEGGFGQVWRATSDVDQRRVAVKVLHLELVRSVDALTRFRRELEAIERLEHPNVVGALGHGTLDDGRPYLVLEYVEGPSLREVIQARGPLPPAEVLAILEPLCEALATAHAAGLVHRDVKASNVMLEPVEGGVRPVLLDFGLVKLVDDAGPGLTSSRSMLGTPLAMAPEQMRGEAVDARTDVYALGLLAFHMLTGQPAYGSTPGVVQSYLQLHGPRPRPSSKVDLDPAIDGPIVRAMEIDRAARFATPRELAAALRAVMFPVLGVEVEVRALYAEGTADEIAVITTLAVAAGMTIAIAAPDCLTAVGPRALSLQGLCAGLVTVPGARIAVGVSQAVIDGAGIDGPALDAQSWAPFPLAIGLWVAEGA